MPKRTTTPPKTQLRSPRTGRPAVTKTGPVGGTDQAKTVARANRWRDHYNPLRGLVISRVVCLLEAGERGEYADLQWLFRFVEKRDAVLRALVKRRRAALQKLDWEIKVVAELPEGATAAMAEAQRQTLRGAYDCIDNLREAIAHLASAEFRGFAHVQKHYAAGAVRHLECLPQWNWVREGQLGAWYFNADANAVSAEFLQASRPESVIDPIDWIIREEDMPIDEIAVIAFVRKNLAQKDWDAFVEIFGLPGCIVVGPPNVPEGKESEYQSAAESVANGASGYLPNGSNVEFPDGVRSGQNPFKEHLDAQNSDLVIAGTGGKLTMLNEATGLGSGNADAHQDAFDDLAIEEASVISELFQRQFDLQVLEVEHPDEPVLAYFELCAKDEEDVTALADRATKFAQAGFEMDAAELSEKSGYRITKAEKPAPQPAPGLPGSPAPAPANPDPTDPTDPSDREEEETMLNRSASAAAVQRLAQAFADDLRPLRIRLERILEIEDEDILRGRLEAFRAELPALLKDINADPAAAGTLEDLMRGAFALGVKNES